MTTSPKSNSVYYDHKEYHETVLNESMENLLHNEEPCGRKKNSVCVTSLDIDEENVEEWPYTCEEKQIPVTVPCSTLSEKYLLSKTVVSPGLKGSRPHFSSICTLTIESMELLLPSCVSVLNHSRLFDAEKVNTDQNYEIGTYDLELEKALDIALLDMFVGEKSQFILCVPDRNQKLRDQEVPSIPCLKCTIHLKRILCPTESSNVQENYIVSLFNLSEERKFNIALDEKGRGIELFQRGQHVNAFYRFAAGCKVLLTFDSLLLDDKVKMSQEVLKLYSTLCSNMAECQLKENNPTSAISLCKKAIALYPDNVKAIYRQAYATWSLGDVDQAHSLLKQVLKLDPNNVAAKRLFEEVEVKIKEYSDQYTEMMKRIFQN